MKGGDWIKQNWKAFAIIGIMLLIIISVYFTVFFYHKCNDISCFYAHEKQCSKTKFINDAEDTTWLYSIQGKSKGTCEISVEVLAIKGGTADKKRLEGLSMDCKLPLESAILPESDISRCHGELKEELQSLIIQKLHKYIVENVNEIGEELDQLI